MLNYIWIAIGGATGSVLRFWLSGVVAMRYGESFPLGTLAVNVIGSFVISFLAEIIGPEGRFLVSPHIRQGVLVGVLGGFTTFSSFSLQTLNLAREGEWSRAGLNVMVSVVACLIAVWLGFLAGRLLTSSKAH